MHAPTPFWYVPARDGSPRTINTWRAWIVHYRYVLGGNKSALSQSFQRKVVAADGSNVIHTELLFCGSDAVSNTTHVSVRFGATKERGVRRWVGAYRPRNLCVWSQTYLATLSSACVFCMMHWCNARIGMPFPAVRVGLLVARNVAARAVCRFFCCGRYTPRKPQAAPNSITFTPYADKVWAASSQIRPALRTFYCANYVYEALLAAGAVGPGTAMAASRVRPADLEGAFPSQNPPTQTTAGANRGMASIVPGNRQHYGLDHSNAVSVAANFLPVPGASRIWRPAPPAAPGSGLLIVRSDGSARVWI
jgi:hypothetical protein